MLRDNVYFRVGNGRELLLFVDREEFRRVMVWVIGYIGYDSYKKIVKGESCGGKLWGNNLEIEFRFDLSIVIFLVFFLVFLERIKRIKLNVLVGFFYCYLVFY